VCKKGLGAYRFKDQAGDERWIFDQMHARTQSLKWTSLQNKVWMRSKKEWQFDWVGSF
jgi:hypothetical protein